MIYDPVPAGLQENVLFFIEVPATACASVATGLARAIAPAASLALLPQGLDRPFGSPLARTAARMSGRVQHTLAGWQKRHPLLPSCATPTAVAQARFVHGQVALGQGPALARDVAYVTLLRPPVERFIAEYFAYHDGLKRSGRAGRAHMPLDLDGYVARMACGAILRPHNVQCLYLAGVESFAEARRVVDERVFLAAPVDRMQAFAALLARPLGLASIPQPRRDLKQERKRRGDALAPDTLRAIEALVAEDMALFDYVCGAFDAIDFATRRAAPMRYVAERSKAA